MTQTEWEYMVSKMLRRKKEGKKSHEERKYWCLNCRLRSIFCFFNGTEFIVDVYWDVFRISVDAPMAFGLQRKPEKQKGKLQWIALKKFDYV